MGAGDFLFDGEALGGVPPGSSAATLDIVPGTSSPPENMHVYDFDNATDEYIDFFITMPSYYSGRGVSLFIEVSAETAIASNFRLAAAFRLRDTSDDWDTTAHTYDFNQVTVAAPGTVGNSVIGAIPFISGADMDGVIANSRFVLRIWRNYSHGDDGAADDMQLERFYAYES